MRLRVVEKRSQALEVAIWAVGFDLLEFGAAIPNFADDNGAVRFGPSSRTPPRIPEARYARFPCSRVEAEIMLAITQLVRFSRYGHCLRKRRRGLEEAAKRAHHEVIPTMPK